MFKIKVIIPKQLKQIIKTFDLFSEPVSLRLFGKTKFSTTSGSLLSVIMLSLLLTISYSRVYSIIYRAEVSIETYDKVNFSPPIINLKNRFAINLVPYFLNSIEGKRYFDFFFVIGRVYYYPNGTEYRTKVYLNVQKCNYTDFPMFTKEQLISFGYENWLCPDFTYNDFNVMGNYFDPLYQYIQIGVSKCSKGLNYKEDDYCATDDEITAIRKKSSGKIYVNFKILNNLLNLNSYEEPISPFVDPMDYLISNKDSFIQREVFFTRADIETDDSRSFTFLRNSNYFIKESTFLYERKYDEFKLNENTTLGDNIIYTSIYLRSGQKSVQFNRKYHNFEDFMQGFGALYSIMFLFFKFLTHFITKNNIIQKIANSLYNFSDIALFSLKSSRFEQNKTSKFQNNFFFKFKEYIKRKKEKLYNTYTIKDISDVVIKDMDLIQILHKMKQFENLKTILFNEDQKILLDFTAKPKFALNSSNFNKKEIITDKDRNKIKNFKQINSYRNVYSTVEKAYKNILKNKDNEINKKIIGILDVELIKNISKIKIETFKENKLIEKKNICKFNKKENFHN